MLDEPTNHLDMLSKDILKMALVQYDGTLIVVSHDRDFLQGLTDTIYEFSHHKVSQFKGDIFEFLQSKKLDDLKELDTTTASDKPKNSTPITQSKQDYLKNKERESALRKMRNRIALCENEIEALEQQIAEMDKQMSMPDFVSDNSDLDNFYKQYDNLKKQISEQMNRWEDLQSELEQAQQQC